ncbi:MAG: QacE family quaternary ammonium compound efflux SMR transporter [Planctomycetia bacterium]|nr:QacE family quaternary ammonium compound efflux SMR transporter [Planctomycetia bacterium]
MPWIQLAVAIIAEVIGTTCLKLSAGLTKPLPTIGVAVAYGLSFWFLSRTLDTIPVGVAYAIWSGAGVTLIAAIGWALLGQKLDVAAFVGMGLIIAGVVVLNIFSRTAAH